MRMKWWKARGGEGERVPDLVYNQKKNKFPLYIYEGKGRQKREERKEYREMMLNG